MSNTQQIKQYDVMIVGAGPVGLTLAGYLSQFGHKIAVFERHAKVYPYPRAGVLDDESLRMFQTLGIVDELWEKGHLYDTDIAFIDVDGNRLCIFNRRSLGEETMDGHNAHYKLPSFHQPSTELILRKKMDDAPNVDFLVPYTVLSVGNNGAKATLVAKNEQDEELHFEAKYIVGCDGANSMVQKQLSDGVKDFEYSEDYLVVDCRVLDDIYYRTRFPDGCYIIIDPVRAGVIGKSLHNMIRFDFRRGSNSIIDENFTTKEDMRRGARDYMVDRGFDPEMFEVVRSDAYTFEAKTPENWRSGRLLVAGDAAHLTPPWSGQGLNMGLRDAANLAFKLDLVLSGKANDGVLDTYTEERMPVSLETIKASIKTGKIMEKNNLFINTLIKVLIRAAGKYKFLGRLMFKDWQKKPPYISGLFSSKHKLGGTLMIQPKIVDYVG